MRHAGTICARPRRGVTLIFVIVILTALIGFVSLSVDVGRAQVVKSQLRIAADAAARAAVAGFRTGGVTQAQTDAVSVAGANTADGSSVVVDATNDVEFGTWNSQARTFTVLSAAQASNANAIRVYARRTAARGTAVPLMFGGIIGRSSCDVTASGVATVSGYAVVGVNGVTLSGVGRVDSYNSLSTSYSLANSTSRAVVVSDANISLSGNTSIQGEAHPGVTGSITLSNGAVVTGSTSNLLVPVSYPNVSAGSYATTNNNSQVSTYVSGSGDFSITGNKTASFPAGVYYFRNFSVQANSTVSTTGDVTIYITGNMSVSGQTLTNNNRPTNLKIRVIGSGSVSLNGGTDLYTDLYAPQASVSISGGGDLYGVVVGATIGISGSGGIHYDESVPSYGVTTLVK